MQKNSRPELEQLLSVVYDAVICITWDIEAQY